MQTHLFIVEDKIYRMRMGLFYGIMIFKSLEMLDFTAFQGFFVSNLLLVQR